MPFVLPDHCVLYSRWPKLLQMNALRYLQFETPYTIVMISVLRLFLNWQNSPRKFYCLLLQCAAAHRLNVSYSSGLRSATEFRGIKKTLKRS